MFGKEQSILEELPHYFLDYQEKISTDPEEWTYRLTSSDGKWEGNLFNFYYRIYDRLVGDIGVPFQLDKNAVRVGETPVHLAIREAVVNTLIHADHSSTQAIKIIKQKNLFVFSNPGCLRISIDRLFEGGESDPRNPSLQTMFRMIGLGERAGSGFPRMLKAWKEQQWFGPLASEGTDLNRTTILLPMVSFIPEEVEKDLRQIVGDNYSCLSELDRTILFFAHRLGDISNGDIQGYSQKHPRDIGDCLKRLVNKGWLEQSGHGRGTYYCLVKLATPRVDVNPAHLDVNSAHLEKLKALAAPVRNKGNVPKSVTRQTILDVCQEDFLTPRQLEKILKRDANNLRLRFLSHMVKEELLEVRYPENPNHPEQAYRTRPHQTEVIQ
ncbi:MAG: hypothetical protein LH613_15930 [Chamaesiphon sp.]|nr:hypothetical protein [Chamaesiphon sp.]